jgi:DNA-binding FadR family transcriptional regulator
MESLSPALMMNKSSAIELLDARLYIEGAVASLAARKATKEDIQGLRSLLEDMRKNLKEGNIKAFISHDLHFHLMIAESSKNRVLMKVVETIRDVLYEFIAGFFSAKPETVRNALEFHARILAAIESRDPQEARRQMESHIRSLIRMIHKWDLTVQLKSESGIQQEHSENSWGSSAP